MGAHRSPATVFRKISISIPRGRESKGDRERGRDRDGGRKKEETSGDRWLVPRFNVPRPHPLFYLVQLRHPRHPRTCLFLQFARRPTIRFPGVVRLPYKCKAQEIGPRSGSAQTARKCVPGGMAAGRPPTPASYNSAFSYLISSTLSSTLSEFDQICTARSSIIFDDCVVKDGNRCVSINLL